MMSFLPLFYQLKVYFCIRTCVHLKVFQYNYYEFPMIFEIQFYIQYSSYNSFLFLK